jgi:Mn2+/Fe2+ NRAMP family transporter
MRGCQAGNAWMAGEWMAEALAGWKSMGPEGLPRQEREGWEGATGAAGRAGGPASIVPHTDVEPAPRTLWGTLCRLGPGMIIAGSIVGSGELILTTKVGAEAGFWLLWLIIIGCVIKVSTQIEFARHTITWGDTPLQALNAVPGPRLRVNWLLWYWTFMTILVVFQQGGILGGVGQTLAISRPLTVSGAEYNRLQDELAKTTFALKARQVRDPNGIETVELHRNLAQLTGEIGRRHYPPDPYIWATVLALVTSALLYVGRYQLIQVVATALVATFTLVTIATVIALQMRPEWAIGGQEIAQGLSFHLPPVNPVTGVNPMRTAFGAFGIIGIGAAELIMYPYWCLEKGYAKSTGPRDGTRGWIDRARGWIRVLQIDAWTSMVVYTFATVAFYLLGAAVLGRIGFVPADRDMVRTLMAMYIPVFGPLGYPIFLAGAFAVLYSTLFVAAAGNSRMVADALGLYGLTDGSEAGRVTWTRRISALWPLVALGLYGFVRAPAAMIVACGIAQSIMLPLLGAAALYFRYRRSDPNLRPGRLWDAMLWIAFAGFLVVGTWSLITVFFK